MNADALYLLADITAVLGKASTALFFAAVLAACAVIAVAAFTDRARRTLDGIDTLLDTCECGQGRCVCEWRQR